MDTAVFSALIRTSDAATRTTIAEALIKFGEAALRFAADQNVRIHPLRRGERYDDASPALKRLGVDCDSWPAPPSGLFVVEERVVYLRSTSPMTAAHEFGHALDCALGGGVYLSSQDPIRGAFASAKAFVTPYAATGSDEYAAEAFRAWVEVNDDASCWPRVSRGRLRRVDPTMYAIVERLFAQFESG